MAPATICPGARRTLAARFSGDGELTCFTSDDQSPTASLPRGTASVSGRSRDEDLKHILTDTIGADRANCRRRRTPHLDGDCARHGRSHQPGGRKRIAEVLAAQRRLTSSARC
jgi:hypothetical protein